MLRFLAPVLGFLTFTGMAALFATIALLASYPPASRAAAANPVAALPAD